MLSGGIAVQAVLSGSNFLVGLLLVRRTADAQYGFYVLITTIILLSIVLQGSFIQGPMINRLSRLERAARADLIGSLLRDQRRLLPAIAAAAVLVTGILYLSDALTLQLLAIVGAAATAIVAALRREFLRMVLFAYRRPTDVLQSDCIYCGVLIGGAFAATLTPFPAATAAFSIAVASLLGGHLLRRRLWAYEPWNPGAPRGALQEMWPQASWSAFGGGTHWLFGQGYNYLVAGMLDVRAVAALAATRLLIMPISLLSTGIGTLMLPTTAKWTNDHGAATVLKRLAAFALGLALLACCYLGVMWLGRDWIFSHVMKKNFADRDLLLLFWAGIALITLFRDQMLYFLVARAHYRLTSMITLVSAILSFAISIAAMPRLGPLGALVGLLAGEFCNLAGILVFSVRESNRTGIRPATESTAKGS